MPQIMALRNTLQSHLGWHGARVTFLALFLVALYRVKTVNLAQIATAFAKNRIELQSRFPCAGRF